MASDVHTLCLLSLLLFQSHKHVDGQLLNQYTTSSGYSGDYQWDRWQSTSDIIPLHEAQFGTITLGNVYTMDFDFVWNGYSDDPDSSGNEFENFFRIGFDDDISTNCEREASRYPLRSQSTDHTV